MAGLKFYCMYRFIIIFLLMNTASYACTSFAIYANKTYYGMNFDWPETEMKFCIEKNTAVKYFYFQFYRSGYFSTTSGMNEKGIVSTIQMLYPEVDVWPSSGITLWNAFVFVLSNLEDVTSFTDYLDQTGTKISHIYGSTLHNLFADKFGAAFVLEVGSDSNLVTPAENGILVMANFPNHQFIGKEYTRVYGVGADRYKAAYKYLLEKKDNFNLENAFETLRRSIQPASAAYATQCSMVFEPEENNIYVVLRRDFSKIWRISLANETIETYSGFDNHHIFSIEENGVSTLLLEPFMTHIDRSESQPKTMDLFQNYPNPFNPATNICFILQKSEAITLRIFNIAGREVATLVDGVCSGGAHEIQWHADGLPGGIYFARLRNGVNTKTIKLVLQK